MSANIKDWRERIYASGLKASPAVEEAAMLAEIADLRAALQAQQVADPMDWPLPCDVKVGSGTNKKGTPLRTLVLRMGVLHGMAMQSLQAQQGEAKAPTEEFVEAMAERAVNSPAPATLNDDFKARFNQLLTASHNAAFDCGEWDNDADHAQTYDEALAKSNAAEVALREFVFESMAAAGDSQGQDAKDVVFYLKELSRLILADAPRDVLRSAARKGCTISTREGK